MGRSVDGLATPGLLTKSSFQILNLNFNHKEPTN